ncbi:DnaB-like helicase C-terminal domain-containing protein [Allorhizobium ampelinum]|uniref:DnaB-like helicase C-terminal domain-containing protein n=1 Tax=Allorhizobium ampelinum TaxID=3025782 RepID=UPI000B3F8024|nr:DnaB-like helicase C-terminal domain-containing protein [Allorhizobium ampelinum]NTA27427.1 hypothetical protein [Allorhizobium ampelinum]OVE94484.1 hypothetical protein B7W85_13105 [Allorhizobium ampelinum]
MNAQLRAPDFELPYAIEIEQALLGSLLINNDALKIIPANFLPTHFSEPIHTLIYEAIVTQVSQGRVAGLFTVKALIPDQQIGPMSLSEYLAALVANAVSIRMVKSFAVTITEAYTARETIHDSFSMASMATTGWSDLAIMDQVVALSGRIKDRIQQSRPRVRIRPGEAYQRYFEQSASQGASGVPIALSGLRQAIGEDAFEASNFYGLLGASGEGKTSVTVQLIFHAIKLGHPVLFMSFDQTPEQVVRQMISQEHGISVKQQASNSMTDIERDKCYDLSIKLDQRPFEVINCQRENAAQLIGYSRQFISEHKNGKTPFIVTDHIRKIRPDDARASPDVQAGSIAVEFKSLAKETSSVCLMLQQRNGQGAGRTNPRPIGKDLYGGEGARQDYDCIAYLYRPAHWKRDMIATASDQRERDKINRVFEEFGEDVDNIAEFGALKCRFGSPDNRARMIFDAKHTRYRPVDESVQGRMF